MAEESQKNRLALLLDPGQTELNGIDYVEVEPVTQTTLYVYFYKNPFESPDLRGRFDETTVSIRGGESIRTVLVNPFEPGNANWEEDVEGNRYLRLEVEAPGDFSVYMLRIESDLLDPYYDHVQFSFKAGCETDVDCRKLPSLCPELAEEPVVIDYLAKDYDSFRQALLDFAVLRYPDWQERSEADFGIMFTEAMSALADELSYYQDRVAAEAYLETATQRKSAQRLARLIDYQVHQGKAAETWLEFQVTGNAVEPGKPLMGKSGETKPIIFETGRGLLDTEPYEVKPIWNTLRAHYWNESECCLKAGARETYLVGHGLGLSEGKHILIETVPSNRSENSKRQIVQLVALDPDEEAEVFDPLQPDPQTGNPPLPLTRVRWRKEDALCTDFDLEESFVRANLVPATHGRRRPQEKFVIRKKPDQDSQVAIADERTGPNQTVSFRYELKTDDEPLTHIGTDSLVGNGFDAQSHNRIQEAARHAIPELIVKEDLTSYRWIYQRDLLESHQFHDHFTLDYQNDGSATIRFGDGTFGRRPNEGTVFEAIYRTGQGTAGNVPPDTLVDFKATDFPGVISVRNPLPARGGVEPESLTVVRHLAPFAFREIVYRAVRPEDYRQLVERDLNWVSRANAAFRWTGSWLTGFVTADPKGTDEITAGQNAELRRLVNRYRMAGTEVYEKAPVYANLDLEITVCAESDAFRGDVKERVLDVLTSGTTRNQEKGFFDPDNFTFGTPLYRSRLEAAIGSAEGVKGLLLLRVRRRGYFDFPADERLDNFPAVLNVGLNEVIRVMNDPNYPNCGSVKVYVEGGK